MQKPLTLGVAGLGTVGAGLLDLLHTHKARFAESAGRPVDLVGISARDKGKDRGVDTSGIKWFDDPVALAKDPGIEVFVELIGGSDGVAKEAVEAALRAGKHVVTANKALVAKHGVKLAKLAEEKGVALNFEAAVAGGIPVIKTLRESLAANEVTRVYGILNGTCNYILSTMTDQHRSFAEALGEAQALGYAEADPTYDIGGFDTAHKLAILTSLAFGTELGFDQVDVEGIQSISEVDIEAAQDMGYAIKLLGVATRTEGGIEARVHPAMVPEESAISEVWGATNAVAIDADFCGSLLLIGPGAGGRATASAVAGDILDIARGTVMPPLVTPHARPEAVHEVKARRAPGRLLRAAFGVRPSGCHGGDRQAHGRSRNFDREHRAAAAALGAAGHRRATEAGRAGPGRHDHARDDRGAHSRRGRSHRAGRQGLRAPAGHTYRKAREGDRA